MPSNAERFLVTLAHQTSQGMTAQRAAERMRAFGAMRAHLSAEFSEADLTDAVARQVATEIGVNFPTYQDLADAIRRCASQVPSAIVGARQTTEAEMYAEVFAKMLAGQGRGPGGKLMGFKDPKVAASMARNHFPKEALDILRQRFPDLFPSEHCAERPRRLRVPKLAGIPPVPQSHAVPPADPTDDRPQERHLCHEHLTAARAQLKKEAR